MSKIIYDDGHHRIYAARSEYALRLKEGEAVLLPEYVKYDEGGNPYINFDFSDVRKGYNVVKGIDFSKLYVLSKQGHDKYIKYIQHPIEDFKEHLPQYRSDFQRANLNKLVIKKAHLDSVIIAPYVENPITLDHPQDAYEKAMSYLKELEDPKTPNNLKKSVLKKLESLTIHDLVFYGSSLQDVAIKGSYMNISFNDCDMDKVSLKGIYSGLIMDNNKIEGIDFSGSYAKALTLKNNVIYGSNIEHNRIEKIDAINNTLVRSDINHNKFYNGKLLRNRFVEVDILYNTYKEITFSENEFINVAFANNKFDKVLMKHNHHDGVALVNNDFENTTFENDVFGEVSMAHNSFNYANRVDLKVIGNKFFREGNMINGYFERSIKIILNNKPLSDTQSTTSQNHSQGIFKSVLKKLGF